MKKIYAIFAFFVFLGLAGTAFAARPVVNLHAASNITASSATLSLSYTSNSPVSAIMFEYSTDPSFGSNSQMVTGTATTVNISGLLSNKTYYYRASVTNNDGPTVDPISGSYNFKTTGSSSSTVYAETLGETAATASSMTLTGRVNTYGTSGTAYFKLYSSNCSSLITTTNTASLSSSSGSQYVNANVSGLNPGTAYCSELVATVNGINYSGGKVIVNTTNNGGSNNPVCSISSFYADSTSINYGSSTILRWNTINCNTVNLTNIGTVSLNDSRSTGALYSTTYYTLTAYGTYGNDSKSVNISVSSNSNPNNNPTYPTCYYTYTCYWNGSTWVSTTNNNYYPNNTFPGTNYPACYYSAQCYWSGTTWVNNTGSNIGGNYDAYVYNPHNPYTGGPNYVYRTTPGRVDTVYVDQPVTNYGGQVVSYNNGYNYGYDTNIMARYSPNYRDYDYNNRVLLTGSAGSAGQITLIGLLIALIIIAIIVYLVRSSQEKNK